MSTNLVNTINLIRKNKKYFIDQEDYLKILTNLYNELSNKKFYADVEINFNLNLSEDCKLNYNDYLIFLNKIRTKTNLCDILNLQHIKAISIKYPLFDLLLAENNLIILGQEYKFSIQNEPIINQYDKQLFCEEIKTFLYLCEKAIGYKNKTIISIIIFHIIFSNFQFVIDHPTFGIGIKQKLKHFKQNELDKIYEIADKYNLSKTFFDKWYETTENLQG